MPSSLAPASRRRLAIMRAWSLLFAVAGLGAGGQSGAQGGLPDGFVDVADVAPGVVVDARYAGSDNFMGRPARGYGSARCLLTSGARALAVAQRELAASGLGLMVYDCYRPQRAVDDFVSAWARDDAGAAQAQPSAAQSRRAQERAVRARLHRAPLRPQSREHGRRHVDPGGGAGGASKSGGAAARLPRARGRLAPDGSLNMGTTFDCFDERSHAADTATPAEAWRNCARLRGVMEKHGFAGYAPEWWHFTLAREPFRTPASTSRSSRRREPDHWSAARHHHQRRGLRRRAVRRGRAAPGAGDAGRRRIARTRLDGVSGARQGRAPRRRGGWPRWCATRSSTATCAPSARRHRRSAASTSSTSTRWRRRWAAGAGGGAAGAPPGVDRTRLRGCRAARAAGG